MEKEYNMNLTKQYKVAFIKDGAKYKSGDEVSMNLALASKFFKQGKIEPTNEMIEDAKRLGCDELFKKSRKSTDLK